MQGVSPALSIQVLQTHFPSCEGTEAVPSCGSLSKRFRNGGVPDSCIYAYILDSEILTIRRPK